MYEFSVQIIFPGPGPAGGKLMTWCKTFLPRGMNYRCNRTYSKHQTNKFCKHKWVQSLLYNELDSLIELTFRFQFTSNINKIFYLFNPWSIFNHSPEFHVQKKRSNMHTAIGTAGGLVCIHSVAFKETNGVCGIVCT